MVKNEKVLQLPKKVQKLSFIDENPEQYLLLQCLRKSITIDKEFRLKSFRRIFLNEKEFSFFGNRIEPLKFGTVRKTKSGHYQVDLGLDIVKRLKHLVEHIHFTM